MKLKHWDSKEVERGENRKRTDFWIYPSMEWTAEGTSMGTQRTQRRRRSTMTGWWALGWGSKHFPSRRWSKPRNTELGNSAWLITEWILVNWGKQGQRPGVWGRGVDGEHVGLREGNPLMADRKEGVHLLDLHFSSLWQNSWHKQLKGSYNYLSSQFHGRGAVWQLTTLCLWFQELLHVIGSGKC